MKHTSHTVGQEYLDDGKLSLENIEKLKECLYFEVHNKEVICRQIVLEDIDCLTIEPLRHTFNHVDGHDYRVSVQTKSIEGEVLHEGSQDFETAAETLGAARMILWI